MKSIHFKLALFGIISLSTIAELKAAEETSFDGCAGTQIFKGGKAVDARNELVKVDKRIKEICEKELPDRLKKIEANDVQCRSGTDANNGRRTDNAGQDLYNFVQNVKEACKAMRDNMEESKRYCTVRKKHLEIIERDLKNSDFLSPKGDPTTAPQGAQAAVFTKQYEIYNTGKNTFLRMFALAEEASESIYNRLPDKDEDRARLNREGEAETADTKDPKLDALVVKLKEFYLKRAETSKNKAACKKLSSENGDVAKVATILKQNLWPNGKRAARTIKTVGLMDKNKAGEYERMANKSREKALALGGTDTVKEAEDQRLKAEENRRLDPRNNSGVATGSKPAGQPVESAANFDAPTHDALGNPLPGSTPIADTGSGSTKATAAALELANETVSEQSPIPPAEVIAQPTLTSSTDFTMAGKPCTYTEPTWWFSYSSVTDVNGNCINPY